jgi:hypothetical protein
MKTAVEWLKDVIESFGNKHELQMSWDTFDEVIEQAKEKELDKLKEAYAMGRSGKSIKEFNETFNQQ